MMPDTPYHIHIVDDDREMRDSLSELLTSAGWQVTASPTAQAALTACANTPPDVIVSDVRMPGISGLELVEKIAAPNAPPIILISAHGDIPMAVQAMNSGAHMFFEKPFDPRQLLTSVKHAAKFSRLQASRQRLLDRLQNLSGLDRIILGQSPQMQDLRQSIVDYAQMPVDILIEGETGTGKELVARALHDLGPRAPQGFVALSCANLPVDHFEQTLFGSRDHQGLLAKAHGGSLFLDEIATCPAAVQAKLLRVLETREYFRIDDPAPRHADFRLICASNEPLDLAVKADTLREDLWFRINSVVLTLPPLRRLPDDIALIFTHFLQNFAQVYEVELPALAADDLSSLLSHPWTGNMRELRNVAQRYVLNIARGLPASVPTAMMLDPARATATTLRDAVAAFERQLITQALIANQGRMDDVAAVLGIGRRTLNEKIVKLGLDKNALL